MKKRILSVVLVVCMLLTLVPTAFAAAPSDDSVKVSSIKVGNAVSATELDYDSITGDGTDTSPYAWDAEISAVTEAEGKKEVAIELVVAAVGSKLKFAVSDSDTAPTWDDISEETDLTSETTANITADIMTNNVVWIQVAKDASTVAVYKLTITEITEITKVDITLATTSIKVNGTLPTPSVTTEPEGGANIDVEWTLENQKVTDASAAGEYTATFTVTPKDGFKLADSVEYTVNGTKADASSLTAALTVEEQQEDKTEPTITPNASTASVKVDESTEITVATDGAVTVENSDETIAKGEVNGTTVTITGVAVGTATVTIKAAAGETNSAKEFTIAVTVTAADPADTWTVSVGGDDAANYKVTPATATKDALIPELTLALSDTGTSAGVALPEEVTITMGGTDVAAVNFTYEPSTGKIAFKAADGEDSAPKATGNIVITPVAQKQEKVNVTASATVTAADGTSKTVTLKAKPATFDTDAALAEETIALEDESGDYTVTDITSIKVGSDTLTPDTDYTFDAGTITFTNSTDATATDDIVIAATVTAKQQPAETYTATFKVTEKDADSEVVINDADIVVTYTEDSVEKTVTPEADKSYKLTKGVEYSYTVTKDGYTEATGKVTEPAGDTTEVAVELEAITYSVTVSKTGEGEVTTEPATTTGLKKGDEVVVTIKPAAGNIIANVIVDGTALDLTNDLEDGADGDGAKTYTATIVDADIKIAVSFVDANATEYTITTKSTTEGVVATNGTVTTAPADKAYNGSTVEITATPKDGYRVAADGIKVTYDNNGTETNVDVADDNTFEMPEGNVTVTVEFETIPKHAVTFAAPTNGTMTVKVNETEIASGDTVEDGTAVTVTVEADDGYTLDKLTVGGTEVTVEADGTYTFTITVPTEIVATFKELTAHTITVATATNGTVAASVEKAKAGAEVELTVTPDAGYELDTLTVTYEDAEGTTQEVTVTDNKFTMPDANVTVTATFKAITLKSVAATVTDDGISEVSATLNNGAIEVSGTVKSDATITVTYTKSNDETGTVSIAYDAEANSGEGAWVAEPAKVTIGATEYEIKISLSIVGANLENAEIVAPTVEPKVDAAISEKPQEVQDAADDAVAAIASNGAQIEGLVTIVNDNVAETDNGDITFDGETVAEATDISGAKTALAASTGAAEATINTVIVPYLDIKVADAKVDTSAGNVTVSLTFDITPMVAVKVSTETDPDDMNDTNTTTVGTKEVAVDSAVTVTLSIPAGFTPTAALHYNDAGVVIERLPVTTGVGTATFVATSFSKYELTSEAQTLKVVYNVADGSDPVADQTITLGTPAALAASTKGWTTTNGGTSVEYAGGTSVDNVLFNELYAKGTDVDGTQTVTLYEVATGGGTITPSPVGPGVTTYAVKAAAATNGKVKVSPTSAAKGATVTVTVTPDDGYVVGTVTAKDADGNDITITAGANGKYTFVMPGAAVTVTATFVEEGAAELPFTDLNTAAWYMAAVRYAYTNGLVNGIDAVTFGPDNKLERGQLVTMLWRAEGTPTVTGDNTFSDVNPNMYYADAIAWAAENDIVTGYEDGTAKPSQNITRAELVVILYRYAQYKGMDVTATDDLSKFTDASTVPAWALTAMQWAVGEGVVNGMEDSTIAPTADTSRAQVAQMLMNLKIAG